MTAHCVFVVDDDPFVRAALVSLLRSAMLEVQAFGSADEFLACDRGAVPSCLVLDLRLPGVSGLDLQQQLIADDDNIPIIFFTGYGDIPTTVQAMKAGATQVLSKPCRDSDLLGAIEQALAQDRGSRRQRDDLALLRERFELLTPREREVLSLVVSGRLNKQTGAELGIGEVTVKIHRRQAMRKMQADSLAELVRMAQQLGLPQLPVGG